MKRLMEKTVFSGLVTAWRFATWPTRRSPDLVNPTTEGVMRLPSGLVITTGSPPSITATTELVVPRSIPIILLMPFVLTSCRSADAANLYNVTNIKCERQLVKLYRGQISIFLIVGPNYSMRKSRSDPVLE